MTLDPVDILLLDSCVHNSLLTKLILWKYQYNDVLTFEGVEAYTVSVAALLSDSMRFPLNDAPGVLIRSLNPDVVITGSTPFVVQAGRNSGSGGLSEHHITELLI